MSSAVVYKPSFDAGFSVGFSAGYEAGYEAALRMMRGFLPPSSPVVEKSRPAPKPRLDGAAMADVMYKATSPSPEWLEEQRALTELRSQRRLARNGVIDPKAKAQIEKIEKLGLDPNCSAPITEGIGADDGPQPPSSEPTIEGKQNDVSRKKTPIEKNVMGGVSKAFDPDGKGKILIIPAGDPASYESVQAARYKEVENEDLEARIQQKKDEKNEELRQRFEARKAERRQQQEKVAQ